MSNVIGLPSFITIVLGVAILLISVVMSYKSLMHGMQLMMARSWPVVPGVVTSSYVSSRLSRHATGFSHTVYRPLVSFDYKVNDRKYNNDLLWFGAKEDWSREDLIDGVERIVAEYPVGHAVKVHYNAKNPAKSVLELRSTGAGVQSLVAAMLFIAGLVLVAIS